MNTNFRSFIFILLAIFLFTKTYSQSEELILQPGSEGKDANIFDYYPDNNFANVTHILLNSWTISGTPADYRSLLEFDLTSIPSGVTITEAYLSLYYVQWGSASQSSEDGPNTGLIKRVTESWEETTVTWNNQPATTDVNQVTLQASTSPTQNYTDIDVTTLIQDMIDNSNYGMLLRLETESHYRCLSFASSDYDSTELHPKLVVRYTSDAGSAPVAPTNLTALESDVEEVTLNWTDNSDNESAFIIQRSSQGNTNYETIDTLASNTTTYVDNNVINTTEYTYRIKAIDPAGFVSYSDPVSLLLGAFTIADGDSIICNTYHMDDGAHSQYQSSKTYTQVLTPQEPDKWLKLEFEEFDLLGIDYLEIYNGPSTSDELLLSLSGSQSTPISVNATNNGGQLTLYFRSQSSITPLSGWKAYVTCIDSVSRVYDITGTTGKDSIQLNWTDTLSNETSFIIQRSLDSITFSTIATVGANETSYTDNNLDQETDYFYRIQTVTADAKSAWTVPVKFTTLGIIAPSNISLSDDGTPIITVSWNDNSTHEEGYIVERSVNRDNNYVAIDTVTADSTYIEDTQVLNNNMYYYRVRGFNTVDTSAYSSTAFIVTDPVLFDAVTFEQCDYYLLDHAGNDDYANNQNEVMVLKPLNPGDKLKLVLKDYHADSWDDLYIYDGEDINAPLLRNYSSNTYEEDSLQSTNSSGALTLRFVSGSSFVGRGFIFKVTCLLVPVRPTNIVSTDIQETQVSLSWDASSDENNGYIISRKTDEGMNFEPVDSVDNATLQFTDATLEKGVNYQYVVQAYNDIGASLYSDTLMVTTLGLHTPVNLSAASDTSKHISLSWTDDYDNESGFLLERSLNQESGYTLVDEIPLNTIAYVDSNLVPGTIYYYRLQAFNSSDTSASSNVVMSMANSVILTDNDTITKCGYYLLDPGGLDNYANYQNELAILFPEVEGQMINLEFESFNVESNYDYLYVYDAPANNGTPMASLTGSQLPADINATNSTGALALRFYSDYSVTREGMKVYVSCVQIPDPPSNLTATDVAKNHVDLQWDDNSTNESVFYISRSEDTDNNFAVIDTVDANTVSYRDSLLETNSIYFYRIVAANEDGMSDYSNTIEIQTRGLATPTSLSADATSNHILLNWYDNSLNETNFIIEKSSTNDGQNYEFLDSVDANVQSYIDSNQTQSVLQYYRIMTINDSDSSEYSNVAYSVVYPYTILDDTVVGCDYHVFDYGGLDNYLNNQDMIQTLIPENIGDKIQLEFIEFALESGYDRLYVYDGASTSAPLIGNYTGSTLPETVQATNAEGKLTLRFYSDFSERRAGYIAKVTCLPVPLAPDQLALVESNENHVIISWNNNANNSSGNIIYRAVDPQGPFTAIDTVASNITSYTDYNYENQLNNYYSVFGYNENGISSPADTLEVYTGYCRIPTNLVASYFDGSSIRLTWEDNGMLEDGFIIEKSHNNNDFESIQLAGANNSEYFDFDVNIGENYTYRVMAYNSYDTSDCSNESSITHGMVNMYDDGEISQCGFYLQDPGGPANYEDNIDVSFNLMSPDYSNEFKHVVKFETCELAGTTDSIIITSAGLNLKTITESNASVDSVILHFGDGTIRFKSDGNDNAAGFTAYVYCVQVPNSPYYLYGTKGDEFIELSWDDYSYIETGFNIYRSADSLGSYEKIATVEDNIYYYVDEDLTNDVTHYYYKVSAQGQNAESYFTNIVKVEVPLMPTSVSNPNFTGSVSLYPIPVESHLKVQLDKQYDEPIHYQVYNSLGQLVIMDRMAEQNNQSIITIDLEDQAEGTYVLKMIIGEEILIHNFVKH